MITGSAKPDQDTPCPEGRGVRLRLDLYRKYVLTWLAFQDQEKGLSPSEEAIVIASWDGATSTTGCANLIRNRRRLGAGTITR